MVTKKPKGLGRGLEALLGPKVNEDSADAGSAAGAGQGGQPSTLQLIDMVPGTYQPRTRMDEGALYELAESIKAQGIMQPILVRRLEDADGQRRRAAMLGSDGATGMQALSGNRPVYEIIAGERRFRAAKLAGLALWSNRSRPLAPGNGSA